METAAELFQKGVEYQERGLIDHAISEYSRALDLEPDSVEVLINLGAAYLQKGLPDRAIQLLSRVLAEQPDNSLALFNLGKAYLYKGEPEQALTVFKQARRLLPDDISVCRSIIQSLLLLNRREEVSAAALEMLDCLSDDLAVLLKFGEMLYEQKCYAEALEVYRKAVNVAVDSSEALKGLAFCQIALDMKDKALTTLRRALMVDPTNVDLHILMVDLLEAQNKTEEAIEQLKRSLEADPQNSKLRAKFEELMRKLPVLRKRIESQKTYNVCSPFETDVYDILDNLYDGKININEALAAFKQLREKDPDDLFVAEETANLLFQARRFDDASYIYDEIYHVKKDDVKARINLAKSVAMAGRIADARAFIEESLRKQPSSADLALALVELYLLERSFEAAWQSLQKVAAENPENTHALFLRGYLGLRLNIYDEAEKAFRTLFAITPADEEAAVWFSRLCILRGRPLDAFPIWEAFDDGIESIVELLTLTELSMAAGRTAEAEALLQRVGEMRPHFLEEHILDGKVHLYAGELSEAVKCFERVLDEDPENVEALAGAAMANLARNKVPKFWICWQKALESDSLYAVLAALIVYRALNFTQRERLRVETQRMLDISLPERLDRARTTALLSVL